MSANPIRGKTLRWTFDDGPMAGKTFEHKFAKDGTVTWRSVGEEAGEAEDGKERTETKYELARINEDVYAVAYLGSSGYTLTTVLDVKAGTVVSFASNEKQLVVQHGTFESAKRAA